MLSISEVLKELNDLKSDEEKVTKPVHNCLDHCIEKLKLLSKLCAEYQEICQNECEGDSSVGIPSCPFYRFPDIEPYDYTEGTLSSQVNPGGCLLQEVLQ